MRKIVFTSAIVALAVVAATSGFAASRGATFTPVPLFPLCTPETPPEEFCEDFPLSTVTTMSADGTLVGGYHYFFSGSYLWSAEAGLNTLGPVNGGTYVSRAGDVVGSTFYDDTYTFGWSALWAGGYYPNQSWNRLPLVDGFSACGGSGQSLYDVSGSHAVGLTWIDEDGNGNGCDGARAFAWSEATGTYVLDDSISGTGSYRANAVNEDGSVITGWSAPGRTASAWINNVETYLCTGDQADWYCDEGWDVTPDGATILFSGASPADFNTRAATYDVASGAIHQLPFPDAAYDPFWDSLSGWAISDDGETVVGEFGGGGFFGSPPYPVFYDRSLDMTIDLQIMLLGQGLDDLFFWYLESAGAVSADGHKIAGYGFNPDGWIQSYVVDLSKVKVCHKPDGNGNGNDRTIAVGWDSVDDHLAHGDVLATCEFARSDAASRFAARRGELSSQSPDADVRRDLDRMMNIRQKVTGQKFDGAKVTNFYPTTNLGNEEMQEAVSSTPEQRLESLRKRVSRHVRN